MKVEEEENNRLDYGWESSEPKCSSDYITPKIIQLLKSFNVQRIADIGCGNGALCREMKDQNKTVVGIENDSKGAEIAASTHPDISFYNYGVQDEPAKLLQDEEKFDMVTSTEVVEHLYNPELLAFYAREILKDDGLLILSTPYHGYLKNLALSIFDHWDQHHTALWHGGHIKFWSRNTLTELLESNGFVVQDFHGVGRAPYLWKSMVLVAKKV